MSRKHVQDEDRATFEPMRSGRVVIRHQESKTSRPNERDHRVAREFKEWVRETYDAEDV